MQAFFAMAWDVSNAQAARAASELARRISVSIPSAGRVHNEDGFFLAGLGEDPVQDSILPLAPPEADTGGAVFGTLFRKSLSPAGEKRMSQIEPGAGARISHSLGEKLYAGYWGSYVAFIRTDRQLLVLADPSASVPCHYMQREGVTVFFSHLEMSAFIDRGQFTVNEGFVSRLLVYDKIQTGETGLNEVRELGAGERLCLDRQGLRRSLVWDPRVFARDVCRLAPDQAARELRATCDHVVRSWASCFRQISVSLSGGLDSSIVLSCLTGTQGGPETSAFHNLLESDDFPELGYAEEAARHAGIGLRVIRSTAAGELPEVDAHPQTTRPMRGFLTQPMMAPFSARRQLPHARAVFTGQGGDHVFHARRSPLTFADHVFNSGISSRMLNQLLDASRLSGYSVWQVIRAALGHERAAVAAGIQTTVLARQARTAGMSPAAVEMGRCFPDWSVSTPGIAPLKSLQVASLAHLHQGRPQSGPSAQRQRVDPLGSQPLVELCLRLPTYLLCYQGIARGLVRHAFRDRIPDSIRRRTSKGSASGYFAEQVGRNHRSLVAALADGELVRRGLLSRADIDLLSDPEGPHVRALGRTLLNWYAIEAWLRSWRGR